MQSFKTAVLDKIVALAEEHPDRSAECRYFKLDDQGDPTQEPMCIVGQVLAEHDVKVEVKLTSSGPFSDKEFHVVNPEGELVVKEGKTVSEVDWNAIGIRNPGPKQIELVREIQANQDSGKTWGEALKRAKREVG